jgi:AraC family transcriptional activator of pobA
MIKTIHSDKIERRQPSAAFSLLRMEDIYEQAGGKTDVPHRHDYYTVLFVEKAKGNHILDFETYPFGTLQVFFVSPGQVHQVALIEKPKGWAFTFSKAFLIENNIPESFISNINLFTAFGDSPPLKLDQITFDRLFRIVQEMESCLPLDLTYRNRALGALLQLFLIYCNNSTTINPTQLDEENSGVCILRDFKQLVEDRYSTWHKVGDYAAEIYITPKHLSHTVKNITGKSAKQIIQDRLLLEAKRLLIHTELSVKEVGYQIGFEEPLHFSSFFKKKEGISPSLFRTQKKQTANIL